MTTAPRIWFITGVSTGIGRCLAEAALERGDTVVGTLRKTEQISAYEALKPGQAVGLMMDVTQPDQVQRAIHTTIERFGQIDVLVNNAGHGLIGAIEEVSDAEAREVFEVNLFGALHVLRAVIPHMRQRRTGTVVNISSQGGIKSFQGSGLYCATKHALEAISESLALEAAHLGIKVLIVEPGVVRTDFAGRSIVLSQKVVEDYAPTVGQRRLNLSKLNGNQPDDPVRSAHAILTALDAPNPPLRLAVGSDALKVMREKLAALQKDFDDWEDLSASADYPPQEKPGS